MTPAELKEMQIICSGVMEMEEGKYIFLPDLAMPPTCLEPRVDALLSLTVHNGYTTKLFLSRKVSNTLQWSTEMVLGRTWFTWSWQGIPANLRPAEILIGHLEHLR